MPTPNPLRTDAPYQFHAFEVSYFSAKVRPALRYKGVWYEERRADLGEIQRRTGLAFIPIVVTPEGETWQDSNEIHRLLEERHPEPPLIPNGALQRMAAHLIELYCDEFALIPAMHYRCRARGRLDRTLQRPRHRSSGRVARTRCPGAQLDVASRRHGPRHRLCKEGFKLVFEPSR